MKIEGLDENFLFTGKGISSDKTRKYKLQVMAFSPIGLNFLGDNCKYAGLAKLTDLDSLISLPKKGLSLHLSNGRFHKFLIFEELKKSLNETLKLLSLKNLYGGGEEEYMQNEGQELLELIKKMDYKNPDKSLIKSFAEHKGFHGHSYWKYIQKIL